MATYDFDKLKRSLAVKVQERLGKLLPDATFEFDGNNLTMTRAEWVGSISLNALTTACQDEERSVWGAIAGTFCNLVVSRVVSGMVAPMDDEADLGDVWPAIVPTSAIEDAMIREATPTDGLFVCERPWLAGLKLQCDFDGPQGRRRVLQRDLESLGMSTDEMIDCAVQNMKSATEQLEISRLGEGPIEQRILCVDAEGAGPAMLLSAAAHTRLLEYLNPADPSQVGHMVAMAPRTNILMCCPARDREAAGLMTSRAWALYEDEDDNNGIPLTFRTVSIAAAGQLALEEMGQTAEKLADWPRHTLGEIAISAPAEWEINEIEPGRWKAISGNDSPRISVNVMDNVPSTPHQAQLLAEDAQQSAGSDTPIAHGFFNGFAWARVDTGINDDLMTSRLFICGPTQVYSIQTAIPAGCPPPKILAMQKVVASVSAI
jgi:hypothetical protein